MAGQQSPQFTLPTKKIFDHSDLPNFRRSIAYHNLKSTLVDVIEKIKGSEVPPSTFDLALVTREHVQSSRTRHSPGHNLKGPEAIESVVDELVTNQSQAPQNYTGVLNVLSQLNRYIDETPPLEGPRRFGNLACRKWHSKAIENIESILEQNIQLRDDLKKEEYFKELSFYILHSFGSQMRLDYGTGHELAFLAFLGGLFNFKVLDYSKITGSQILVIFAKYYDLARRLILVYNLEPAGSHGVWGLDDHFHLIYILGAAQFNSGRTPPPVSSVLSSTTINEFKGSNLYVNAIAFIFKIKSGPFNEHSPILYDIHANVSLWSKVLQGLLKMYEVEVLGKFPVVQHFWFGSALFPWKDFETNMELPVNQRDDTQEDTEEIGFINGARGVNTTRTNISLTGAPWAKNSSPAANPRTVRPPAGPTGPTRR